MRGIVCHSLSKRGNKQEPPVELQVGCLSCRGAPSSVGREMALAPEAQCELGLGSKDHVEVQSLQDVLQAALRQLCNLLHLYRS